MALTKEDLSGIKEVVTEVVDDRIDKFALEFDKKIDALALHVGEGFNEVSGRFDRVERRLDRMESDIREVKWDLADTVRRGEFRELRDRVERLEKKK